MEKKFSKKGLLFLLPLPEAPEFIDTKLNIYNNRVVLKIGG